MKILIFEGIATSGKSTAINTLVKSFPDSVNCRVYTEQSTHIPIMKKTDTPHKEFFTKLVSEALAADYDLVIFDRLYLTQAFRADSSLKEYTDIEMLLFTQDPITIFLKVDEVEIGNRISVAASQREPSWGDYVSTKGETAQERANYYIGQQRNQLELLRQSQLPYQIYDTTGNNYKSIVEDIKKKVLKDL